MAHLIIIMQNASTILNMVVVCLPILNKKMEKLRIERNERM